jgi:sirohydrochlorin ferrochelatase
VSRPALVLCSHGTADPAGQAAVSALVAAVRSRLADVEVRETWVDVQEPQVEEVVGAVVAEGFSPVTLVPLLLSGGYHVHVDVARAAAADVVRATPALGPDPRLADLLLQRLREAGADDADAVVVAAAGSSDARAVADVAAVVDAVRAGREGPVGVGFGSMATPSVPDAVARTRAGHPGRRVVVAGYLLAPGFFHDRLARAGADLVTEPLVPVRAGVPVVDDRLVALVVERFRAGS